MPSKIKKPTKFKRLARFLNPTTPLKQMLTFVVIFGLIGGGYYLYRSYAASAWDNYVTFFHCPTFGIPGTIQQGSTGNCVSMAQYILSSYAGQKINVDGNFGPATKQAVINWQTVFGVKPINGIVGSSTWYSMEFVVNSRAPAFNPQTTTYYCNTAGIHINNGHNCSGSLGVTIENPGAWYGPYRNMTVPPGGHGIKACYTFSQYGLVSTVVNFDVSTDGGRVRASGWQSILQAADTTTYNRCVTVAGGPGTVFKGVEARVWNNNPPEESVPGLIDAHGYPLLNVRKTTLSYY